MEMLSDPLFWAGLGSITLINIVLSGDNAVVIALAARSLPDHQRGKAVMWGAGAAVVMRIILTIIAVEMLKWPFLKIIGAILLFWIAVKLLVPEAGNLDDITYEEIEAEWPMAVQLDMTEKIAEAIQPGYKDARKN